MNNIKIKNSFCQEIPWKERKSTDGGKMFSRIKITNDLTPQLWDGSTWLTPGYGHLRLKEPLCWKKLNHTKKDQHINNMKLGWVICESQKEWLVSIRTQWICGTNLWPQHLKDGYEGVAWDSHKLKVIHVNKLEVTPTNLSWVQVQWVKNLYSTALTI